MYLKSNSVWIFIVTLLSACANIVAPQGGKKDTTPPAGISSYPKDSSINFSENYILITFSENIQLKEPEKNIVISPVIKGGLSFDVNKNKLKIKFRNLRSNTTYTINAKNTIADLTESNTLTKINYVFSTGPLIELNHIKGKVIRFENLNLAPNILVCLYKEYTDSAIINGTADYFTLTDEQGRFDLENISTGSYRIVAIEDKNNNKHWEAGEGVAFLNNPVVADSNSYSYTLRLFQQQISTNHLISAGSNEKGIYEFEFNNYNPVPVNQEDPFSDKKEPYQQKFQATICTGYSGKTHIITSLHPADSAHFNYTINGQLYHTSVKVSKNAEKLQPEKFSYTCYRADTLQINFLRLLDYNLIQLNKISLFKDTSQINISHHFYHANREGIQIKNLDKGKYLIQFKNSAITDIYGITNDSFQIALNILDQDDLQTITITADSTLEDKTYNLRISNENSYCKKYKVVSNQTVIIPDLIPGKYIVVLSELNESEIFKRGNVLTNTLPEKILYYKEINLKTGFDIEEKIGVLYK